MLNAGRGPAHTASGDGAWHTPAGVPGRSESFLRFTRVRKEKEVEKAGEEKEVEEKGMKSSKMKLLIMRSECRQLSRKLSNAQDDIEGVKGALNIHSDEYVALTAAAKAVTEVWAWLVESGMKGENDD